VEVERIGEWYLDQLVKGETPSHEEILADHPDIARLLARRLKLMDMMRGARPTGEERSRGTHPSDDAEEEDVEENLGVLHELGPPVGAHW
jgi:hypothetical protein